MSERERQLYESTCPSRNKWDGRRYDVACDQMAWEAWEARARIAEQREAELTECLQWYEKHTKDVNRRGDLGYSARNAIANDAGKRARTTLENLAKHEQEQ